MVGVNSSKSKKTKTSVFPSINVNESDEGPESFGVLNLVSRTDTRTLFPFYGK